MRSAPLLVAAALLTVSACSSSAADGVGQIPPASGSGQASAPSSAAATPGFKIEEVYGELQHGWDIGFLPEGKILVSERIGRFTLLSSGRPGATGTRLKADTSDILVQGEGGLMGMVIHPDFKVTRQFTTCQTHTENGKAKDIRLVTWQLSDDEQA